MFRIECGLMNSKNVFNNSRIDMNIKNKKSLVEASNTEHNFALRILISRAQTPKPHKQCSVNANAVLRVT